MNVVRNLALFVCLIALSCRKHPTYERSQLVGAYVYEETDPQVTRGTHELELNAASCRGRFAPKGGAFSGWESGTWSIDRDMLKTTGCDLHCGDTGCLVQLEQRDLVFLGSEGRFVYKRSP